MDDAELTEIIQDLNPWRKSKEVNLPEHIIERDIKKSFEKKQKGDNVVGIVGLRRTGKTTLLKQQISDLEKYNRTCYYSFDLEEVTVKQLVEVFCEKILNEPVSKLENEVYFFLDEVQNIENWSNHVKHFQDNYSNINFVVTGSSAANILKGAGESLAGRFTHVKMRPFSFKEYLEYNSVSSPEISLDSLQLPDNSRELRVKFNSYIQEGGMPELYRTKDDKERLEEVIDLVFFRDIVEIFDIKRPKVLKGIFRIVAQNSGQKVNYANLADSLDSDFRTINNYIQYLSDSFLISESEVFKQSEMSKQRKNPKLYASDHSYAKLYGAETGLIAETIAFNHLCRLESTPKYVGKPEADILLEEESCLFEVKYSDKISDKVVRNLVENGERIGADNLYIITDNVFEKRVFKDREVELVPLWLLCLATSN